MKGTKRNHDTFATSLTRPAEELSVEVKDLGLLKLPLTSRTKGALLKLARPARYGKKDKTLHDPTVRRTWEIPKSKIKLDAREHREFFRSILQQVAQDLGLGETELKAELHNLLIYEEGDFFKPHQDSEKGLGMIATLTVVLPSTHSGGGFHVYHKGEEKKFYSSRVGPKSLHCIAFYADCIHEVRPVTSGFRVALTFNLYATKSVTAAPPKGEVNQFTSLIEQHLKKEKVAGVGVYLLDHQYTEASFSWKVLKQSDGRTARAIFAAAQELGLEAYLVLAEIHEYWTASFDYEPWSPWRGYSKPSDPTAEELFDCEISLSQFRDLEDKKCIDDSFLVNSHASFGSIDNSDLTPVEQQYEGYMGNYGNTLEYWYRRAGVVFWRKEGRLALLLKEMPEVGVKEVIKRIGKGEDLREPLKTVLEGKEGILSRVTDGLLVKLAIAIKEPSLAATILKNRIIDLLPAKASSISALQAAYGESWLEATMAEEIEGYKTWEAPALLGRMAPLLEKLKDSRAVLILLLQFCLDRYKANLEREVTRTTRLKEEKERQKQMRDLVPAMVLLGAEAQWEQVFSWQHDAFDLAFMREVVLSHWDDLTPTMRSHWKGWEKRALEFIASEASKIKGALGSWNLLLSTSCKCDLCDQLNEFLQADQQEKVWPLRQSLRGHIHRIIDDLGVPITHKTLRQGSPQKLVLTKLEGAKREIEERYERYRGVLDSASL